MGYIFTKNYLLFVWNSDITGCPVFLFVKCNIPTNCNPGTVLDTEDRVVRNGGKVSFLKTLVIS